MFNKKLKQHLARLESFLGIIYDEGDWEEYALKGTENGNDYQYGSCGRILKRIKDLEDKNVQGKTDSHKRP